MQCRDGRRVETRGEVPLVGESCMGGVKSAGFRKLLCRELNRTGMADAAFMRLGGVAGSDAVPSIG